MTEVEKKLLIPGHVRVGVGVFVMRDGKILLGKRKGSHGEGSYALPGGHIEVGEDFEQCARREVMEETGLALEQVTFAYTTNDIMVEDRKHYVTVFVKAVAKRNQEPQNLEPHKCMGWGWYEWDKSTLPTPRFIPLENIINSGYNPFHQCSCVAQNAISINK